MSMDINNLGKKELSEHIDNPGQHSNSDQEATKVDEITIVIRGGKVVKFEQRFV